MITPYYGEFLVSPIPLELSLNYCSHKCAYCFANLNVPDRKASIKSIMNLLQQAEERQTLVAKLVSERYPVLISNKVDPFAASNWQQALPIIGLMHGLGFQMAFQTKGGRGIDDVLRYLPRSAWYVSVSFIDDALRKKIEPGAPSIESRFDLITKLISLGHHVSVGINPLVQEWLPDIDGFLMRLHDLGVRHAWIETLHLNNNQSRNMTPRELEALGPKVIKDAFKKAAPAHVMEHFLRALESARMLGMQIYCVNNPYPSDYFVPYEEIYTRRFPSMQRFVNWCHDTKRPGEAVTFAEFAACFDTDLPKWRHKLVDYIGASTPIIKTTHQIPAEMSYRQLIQLIWQEPRTKANPLKNFAFAEQSIGHDDNGLPVLAWSGEGIPN